MHTRKFDIDGYGEVVINANQDWSGLASVCWDWDGKRYEVEIPGELFLRLAPYVQASALRDDVGRFIENWPDNRD